MSEKTGSRRIADSNETGHCYLSVGQIHLRPTHCMGYPPISKKPEANEDAKVFRTKP
jgi:hypothetical protein